MFSIYLLTLYEIGNSYHHFVVKYFYLSKALKEPFVFPKNEEVNNSIYALNLKSLSTNSIASCEPNFKPIIINNEPNPITPKPILLLSSIF
jgi:hypothetical protein